MKVEAKIMPEAFGRVWLDDVVRHWVESGGNTVGFEAITGGWMLTCGTSGTKVLASGPRWSEPFGRELFRKLTGKDIA